MWELDFWTVVLEETLESPLDCKELQPVHPKGNQSWILIGRTDAEAEPPILWPPDVKNWLIGKDPDAGKLKAEGEGDDRGWDGWMASPTQWTWVWASSRNWWWTGKPGVLQSMGSQRVGHDWVTKLNLIILRIKLEFWKMRTRNYYFHSEKKAKRNDAMNPEEGRLGWATIIGIVRERWNMRA